VTAVPLRRNRDFLLLQLGQLLSDAGTQSTSIAYPLLVLAVTGSAAKAGVVSFARTLPWALFALVAGVVADRWNRKRLMITADGVRVLATGSLAAAILLHIANPHLIGSPPQPGTVGLGDPFALPFQTIESTLVLNRRTLVVANDNNDPFSAGAAPGSRTTTS
jgi:MFS family permease